MKKSTWIGIVSAAALCVLIVISLVSMSQNPAISDKMEQSIAKVKVRYAVMDADDAFAEKIENAASNDFMQTEVPEKTPEPTPEPIADGDVQVTGSDAAPEPTLEEKNMAAAKQGVLLVFMPEPEEMSAITGPAVILTDEPENLPDNVSVVITDSDAAAEAAWDVLYSFPSHCSPIRTISLFAGRDRAYELQQELIAAGKLHDKGTYIEGTGMGTPEKWIEEAINAVPVGLLDTIYAESESLAKAAYDALKAAKRNDSVEVICSEVSEDLVALMIEDHWLMGACAGTNLNRAAEEMLRLAAKLTETGETETVALSTEAICSDDVLELYGSGVTEPTEIMNKLLEK